MKIYSVGGAVRDQLLGLPVKDRDHVVVGATPEDMEKLGYRPVGKDFPVFLHPRTHEEYALARTERKSGRGYQGFTVYAAADVTLEEDLARRDLTINAMALAGDGSLVDPFGGVRDLEARVLRHVSPAFVEDPVRILRLARFAARFAGFSVAPETFELLRHMVATGEADHLVPERVWQEFARGLQESHPARMLEILHGCGALARIAPGLEHYWTGAVPLAPHILATLERAARDGLDLAQRFALLVWRMGEENAAALAEWCRRMRVPNDCRDLALLLAREHGGLRQLGAAPLGAEGVLALFERCDAVRRPERLRQALVAWRVIVDALQIGRASCRERVFRAV